MGAFVEPVHTLPNTFFSFVCRFVGNNAYFLSCLCVFFSEVSLVQGGVATPRSLLALSPINIRKDAVLLRRCASGIVRRACALVLTVFLCARRAQAAPHRLGALTAEVVGGRFAVAQH